ncbi:zinc-binding dehydrogenase [Amycolatopsis cynarae]|uniref:zinc-binding dehydrogenase n=1 Tax=Amycolatopsis cynarae TaxID=2995223 RepID=UPI003898FFBF
MPARGELRPVVHEVLPLDQAVRAHRTMDAGEAFGRIVLKPKFRGSPDAHLGRRSPATRSRTSRRAS